jgi:hypothetical protein
MGNHGPVSVAAQARACGFREVGRVTYRKAPLIYFEALPRFRREIVWLRESHGGLRLRECVPLIRRRPEDFALNNAENNASLGYRAQPRVCGKNAPLAVKCW